MTDRVVETGNCWEASNRILETAQLENWADKCLIPPLIIPSCVALRCSYN